MAIADKNHWNPEKTWARLTYKQRLSDWLQKDFNSYKLNTDLTYNTGSRGQLHFEVNTLSQMSFGAIGHWRTTLTLWKFIWDKTR